MIVRKVAFEKTIRNGNYSNDRPIVVEADLEPGETKEQAWTRINQDMIEWHKKEYPHLYQDSKPDNVSVAFFDANGRMTGVVPIINKDFEQENGNRDRQQFHQGRAYSLEQTP